MAKLDVFEPCTVFLQDEDELVGVIHRENGLLADDHRSPDAVQVVGLVPLGTLLLVDEERMYDELVWCRECFPDGKPRALLGVEDYGEEEADGRDD